MKFQMPNLDPFYWGGRLLRAIMNSIRDICGLPSKKDDEVAKAPVGKSQEDVLQAMSEIAALSEEHPAKERKLEPDDDEKEYVIGIVFDANAEAAFEYASRYTVISKGRTKGVMIAEVREDSGLPLSVAKDIVTLALEAA